MSTVSAAELLGRISRVRQYLNRHKFSAIVTFDPINAFYLTGMSCSNPLVLITQRAAWFMTDFRYAESARTNVTHMDVKIFAQHTLDAFGTLLKKLRLRNVAFEGSLPFDTYEKLASLAPGIRWTNAGSLFRHIRQVKSANEIQVITKNQALNEKIYLEAKDYASVGKTESQIRAFIRRRMLELDADEAFDTIIAAGKHSAEPHARASSNKVVSGQYLLFDMGVKRSNYHSDMTRTVGVGRTVSAQHHEIYDIVLSAQKAGLAAIRPGVPCSEVDEVARKIISDAGYGDFFGHGLGHGVGLQIHECPTLNALSNDVLEENMVVTIEPGIYIPGFGGVRIEDLLVVTGSGYRNLTRCPKELALI